MFKCEICGKVVLPGIKCKMVVVEKRKKKYPYREDANRAASWKDDRQERINSLNDYGGDGFETSKEVRACPQCAASFAAAEIVGEVEKIDDDKNAA